MMRAFGVCRFYLIGLGMYLALGGAGRCNDPAEPSRDSIIQGVRDDVRRKIKEQSEIEARKEPVTVGRASSRHEVRQFNSDAKEHHWGKRNLKRDE
jgi:hypothetical protein